MSLDLRHYYSNLREIRELFHSLGKIEDSNAKLDEILKYLSIFIHADSLGKKYYLDFKNKLNSLESNPKEFCNFISKEFLKVKSAKNFKNENGTNIYAEEVLLTNEDDFRIVKKLIFFLLETFEQKKKGSSFDVVNEIFGSFIRDNFRSNIEDAQYLTPIELVDFACNLSLTNIEKKKIETPFIVADPFCGVGSFLERFFTLSQTKLPKINKDLILLGQDKVERMSRFAHINFLLSNIKKGSFRLSVGNSFSGTSKLDNYLGKVDLILTNPPFGANINLNDIYKNIDNSYPFISDILKKRSENISSESISISRGISLLKPGGQLSIVVPDSVVSSYGFNKLLRTRLSMSPIELNSIIALPSVAFAQAGTMTKTHLITFKKEESKSKKVFISVSEDLGFKVKTKKGIKEKVHEGKNDLIQIEEFFKDFKKGSKTEILSLNPSVTLIDSSILKEDHDWTPSHYSSKKINAILSQKKNLGKDFNILPLSDVADFITTERKEEIIEKGSRFISVLHIVSSKSLDFDSMNNAEMKDPGIKCYPGDLIFSKINPRIPRALVIPNLDFPISCSREFEILSAKKGYSNYYLKFLLLQSEVQSQILSMTSGTSASHNRIRSEALKKIKIPIPKKTSKNYRKINNLVNLYRQSNKELYEVEEKIFRIEEDLDSFFL